ncbi:unnamed protein product [Periconia digitata]|uniref:Uncharacterized protein n=1 Tax=Periconia digitata TaxID=1303443 RepID=A0A9W4UN55_9PLEO|nr:unnamed protein product [Periconia digitata]
MIFLEIQETVVEFPQPSAGIKIEMAFDSEESNDAANNEEHRMLSGELRQRITEWLGCDDEDNTGSSRSSHRQFDL